MKIGTLRMAALALPIVLAAWVAAGAQTTTITDPRPVDAAASALESAYGWAITYEDPPRVFAGDLEDATARVRRDGKNADEPGVSRILLPRVSGFSFTLGNPPVIEARTRAPEAAARAAILGMLKSYSDSIGGAEMFALSDSNGIFHIVPAQRRDAHGRLERIAPVLDTVVEIPPGQRTASELVAAVCEAVSAQTGAPVYAPGNSNLLRTRTTQIASVPNESARSILSRLFAAIAMPRPASWHLFYQPGWGYALNVRLVSTSPVANATPAVQR